MRFVDDDVVSDDDWEAPYSYAINEHSLSGLHDDLLFMSENSAEVLKLGIIAQVIVMYCMGIAEAGKCNGCLGINAEVSAICITEIKEKVFNTNLVNQ